MARRNRASVTKVETPKKDVSNKRMLKQKPKTPDQRLEELELSLPDELSEPANEIEQLNFLVYGPKGIGKTSLCSRFSKSFTLQFEPGGKLLKTFQKACPEWIYFKKYVRLLVDEGQRFNTLVIDTGALAYEKCMQYVCEKAGIEHPGDEGYGKGWNRVSQEFSSVMNYSMSLGLGAVIICHSQEKEVETASGRKFMKMQPQLSGQAESYFSGPVDVVGYYHYQGKERWLQIIGDDYIEAKCRAEENFIAKDGKRVHQIPMGDSPDEAYENIVKAFNNEQEDSYTPEELIKEETKVKPKKSSTRRRRN